MQLWNDILDILKAPVVGDLDTRHLFLLVGLILVIIMAWIFILQHIRAAASEAV